MAVTPPVDAAEPLVFTQVPARSTLDGTLTEGARIVLLDRSGPEPRVTNLTQGFAAAGRPDVSFDGTRILFVARQGADDPLNVWEMSTDGSGVRQVTEGVGRCRRAIYLSTIYTIDAAAPAEQIAFCGEGGGMGVWALYTCRLDGTGVRQITFNPYGATDPCLLGDGRLLFSAWRDPASAALLTVNTDGSDVFVFAAAHEPAARRGMPCETPDGWVVYVESDDAGGDGGGSLVTVSSRASLHSRRVIAAEASGRFRSPSPLSDGNLLVSYRAGDESSYGIEILDPRSGARSKVYDAPQWHDLDAMEVQPRRTPAGRSSVVDDRRQTGLLYCMDTSLSTTAVEPGQVKWIEVYSAVSRAGNDTPQEQWLGTAPVESDGSFHLSVPARTPLRLQTLDDGGRVIQAMSSWIWVMPREARGCIGCHEDRELSPPNRHALALRRPPHPVGVAEEGADH
jgi:hypothetical protein